MQLVLKLNADEDTEGNTNRIDVDNVDSREPNVAAPDTDFHEDYYAHWTPELYQIDGPLPEYLQTLNTTYPTNKQDVFGSLAASDTAVRK